MKITTSSEFDVFELFVHDSQGPGTLDEYSVANALTEFLLGRAYTKLDWAQAKECVIRCSADTGLDRFTFGEIKQRMHSINEVKKALPANIVVVLELLNQHTWKLKQVDKHGNVQLVRGRRGGRGGRTS